MKPDTVVVRMGKKEVTWRDLLSSLALEGELERWRGKAVESVAVLAWAEELSISVTPAELQHLFDRWRSDRGLHQAQTMERWLKERELTLDDLDLRLEAALLAEKIRARLAATDAERAFREQGVAMDGVVLRHLEVRTEELAREVAAQIRENELSFAQAARRHSVDGRALRSAGFIGLARRKELPADLHPRLFGAAPGSVVGPVRTERGTWRLYQVEELVPAELDDHTRAEVASGLFEDRLKRRVEQAAPKLAAWT